MTPEKLSKFLPLDPGCKLLTLGIVGTFCWGVGLGVEVELGVGAVGYCCICWSRAPAGLAVGGAVAVGFKGLRPGSESVSLVGAWAGCRKCSCPSFKELSFTNLF